jgi:hypothetical protein
VEEEVEVVIQGLCLEYLEDQGVEDQQVDQQEQVDAGNTPPVSPPQGNAWRNRSVTSGPAYGGRRRWRWFNCRFKWVILEVVVVTGGAW